LTLQNHFLTNVPSNIEQLKINHIFSLYEYVCGLPNKTSGKNLIISVFNTFVEWLDLTEQISPSFAKKYKFVFVKFNVNEEPKSSYITLENYKACPSPKELLLVKNADHVLSFVEDEEGYIKTLHKFLKHCDLPQKYKNPKVTSLEEVQNKKEAK
jgi:hypothetical protein